MIYETLPALWNHIHAIHKEHFPDNQLMPILGNGETYKPKVMFVFINPTAKNISSDKSWKGPRFPFIGTKQVWRIFHRAGLFDEALMSYINHEPYWSIPFTNKVLAFLKNRRFYFTNIVKWTGQDAKLPDAYKINLFLPILQNEIKIVQPEYIVTFGLIPFEKLTNQKIRLRDYYDQFITTKQLQHYELKLGEIKTKVIPCYFPVGRGDPKKAVEMLKMIKNL